MNKTGLPNYEVLGFMKLFCNNSYNYYYISYYSAGDTLYKRRSGGTALCTKSIA